MGQQQLIYAFVARGTVVLAEYTEFTGNFTTIAAQCLQKLPASNNKFTYNCDGHTFNYLVEDGFTYCVVAVESVGRQIPIAFLDRIKEDFTKKYGGGKAATAAANSLNREFGSKLKEHMQYCVDHPEEVSKLAKVKAQVSEVKGVMMENIEKVWYELTQKDTHICIILEKGRTQCRRLPAMCGVWGRVVFKPQALPTQMCRGWGSNPGPSGYRRFWTVGRRLNCLLTRLKICVLRHKISGSRAPGCGGRCGCRT
ncbi:hypothetical protein PVAP13_2NG073600 [Panicum virgatum]|uniref:Longin domain-containing protein n=1 Tax=Panicum virgatum TaxID=38727 RepID=A0A8T0VAR3_PANVG|nr:hypothetical protein PVAP13_2NG073600 [Panicum virgatum]